MPTASATNRSETRPYSGSWRVPWVGVPTTDGKAIVWYQEGEARAQASARAYARYLPEIWSKLTRRVPRAEERRGRADASTAPTGASTSTSTTRSCGSPPAAAPNTAASAVTMPYPSARGRWCTDRPSWIAIDAGESRFTLAHELMHAIEFAHRYATCDDVSWWDEGGANWAADFVYPGDNVEQSAGPTGSETRSRWARSRDDDYEAFPFWTMLQRTLGTGVLRQIFAQLGGQSSVPAVNAAIPGGYARQWPRFAFHLLNQPPVGTLGFRARRSPSERGTAGRWRRARRRRRASRSAASASGRSSCPRRTPTPAAHRLRLPPRHGRRQSGPRDPLQKRQHRRRRARRAAARRRLLEARGLERQRRGHAVPRQRERGRAGAADRLSVNKNQSGSLGPFAHELRGRNACRAAVVRRHVLGGRDLRRGRLRPRQRRRREMERQHQIHARDRGGAALLRSSRSRTGSPTAASATR